MREVIETGKTIEEAVEKALAALALPREDVSVEVLETPRRKLFGSVPAKVRAVSLIESEGEEKAPVAAPAPAAKEPVKAEAPAPKATPLFKEPKEKEEKRAAPAAEKPLRPTGYSSLPEEEEVVSRRPSQGAGRRPFTGEPSAKARAAMAFIDETAGKMGIEDAQVGMEKDDEITLITLTGKEVGALIGRRGETMEALSYLMSLVANKAGGDYEKLSLDVGGYREKREEDLQVLARRTAEKVANSGRSFTFEPMSAYERRIIHSVIKDMEGVTSQSHGEGAGRRIVVTCTDPSKAKPDREGTGAKPRSDRGGRSSDRRSDGERKPAGPREGARPSKRGGKSFGGNSGGEKRRSQPQDYNPAPVAQRPDSVGQRPGKGPDDELLEQLEKGTSRYGKIEL